MAPVRLVACPDDYLLEESLKEAAAGACAALGVEAETLPEDSAPVDVAYEVRSPSLFAPARVLVVAHAGPWVAAAPRRRGARDGADDGLDASLLEPLVEIIADGVPDEIALILGACCAREPKGPLADAIRASSTGTLDWLPLPADPKPWEETLLSDSRTAALRGLLARTVPEARFERDAGKLLLERLGFAPRRLVAEVAQARRRGRWCGDRHRAGATSGAAPRALHGGRPRRCAHAQSAARPGGARGRRPRRGGA